MNITVGNITAYWERRNTAPYFPFMSEPEAASLSPILILCFLCTLINPPSLSGTWPLGDSLHVPASLAARHGHVTSFWPMHWEQMWWVHLPGCALKGKEYALLCPFPFHGRGPLGLFVRRQSARDAKQQNPGNLGFRHQHPVSYTSPCFTAHCLRDFFTVSLGQKERLKNSIY